MASSSRTAVHSLGRREFCSSSRQWMQNPQSPQRTMEVGQTQLNRLEEHYHTTLARDLLYMNYDHPKMSQSKKVSSEQSVREWDLASPYSKNRPTRPNRGNRQMLPATTDNVVELDRIVISAFCSEAITNKSALVPLLAQMRAITGKPILGSLADPGAFPLDSKPRQGHIDIIRSKSGVALFKLRAGMPVGVKTVLPSKSAYEFLEVFTTFVLPRLRSFNGFLLPPTNQPDSSPAMTSGVVHLGMSPEAIRLFPQTEVNWDAFPNRGVGFQIDCITNQRGSRATEKARQLLSGLGVPFVRRGDL